MPIPVDNYGLVAPPIGLPKPATVVLVTKPVRHSMIQLIATAESIQAVGDFLGAGDIQVSHLKYRKKRTDEFEEILRVKYSNLPEDVKVQSLDLTVDAGQYIVRCMEGDREGWVWLEDIDRINQRYTTIN